MSKGVDFEGIGCAVMMWLFMFVMCGGLLYVGCSEYPPEDRTEYQSLGSVNVAFTETTQRKYGNTQIQSVKFEVEFLHPGEYLFEGWTHRYRASDVKNVERKFTVDKVPYKETLYPRCLVHRLEVTVVRNGKLERSSAEFSYRGITGAFNVQGQPKP